MNAHCSTQSKHAKQSIKRNNLRDASLHLAMLGKESEPVSKTGCKKKKLKTNKSSLKSMGERRKMVHPAGKKTGAAGEPCRINHSEEKTMITHWLL